MEPTPPKVRIGSNVHLIGYGYGDERVVTFAVIASGPEAAAVADAQTIRAAREAVAEERPMARVTHLLDVVPLLTVIPVDDAIDDARTREALAAPRRVHAVNAEALREGDIVKGSLADQLPVGAVIVPDALQNPGFSGYGEACLKMPSHGPRTRWASIGDPTAGVPIGLDAWWRVLYIPGVTT